MTQFNCANTHLQFSKTTIACALIKCMANRTIFLKAYSNTDVKIFFSFVLEEVRHLIFFITIIYIYDILYISQN